MPGFGSGRKWQGFVGFLPGLFQRYSLSEVLSKMPTHNIAVAALLLLGFCCAGQAQPTCSMHNVVGQWAYNVAGWDIPQSGAAPVQMVFMGVLNIDWSGKVTGPGTFAMGAPIAGMIPPGQALDYDFVDGSIHVTADCTGLLSTMMKIKGPPVPPIGPYVGRIIVFPDKGEMVAMSFQAPGTEKPMWTYTLRRMTHVPGPVQWPQVPPAPAGAQ